MVWFELELHRAPICMSPMFGVACCPSWWLDHMGCSRLKPPRALKAGSSSSSVFVDPEAMLLMPSADSPPLGIVLCRKVILKTKWDDGGTGKFMEEKG